MSPIPTVRFGKTNALVPRVSLGTWAFGGENFSRNGQDAGWSGHDDGQAKAALLRAYELGITHWDTADVYGNGRSEELIGQLFAPHGPVPRERIFLASKVGWYQGDYPHYYHPELVRRQIDASLVRLKTDVIDLFYLHHCDFGPGDRWLGPALQLLRDAQQAGKVRHIGLSDWSDEAILRVVEHVKPDAVQPYRNVTRDTFASSGLRAYCDRHDLGVAFFSPLRQGLLLGKYNAPTTFDRGDVRNSDRVFQDVHALHRLAENAASLRARFGERSSQPVLATLIATCLADCETGTVLVGMRNPEQVDAAAAAATLDMSDEELAWVRSLYAGIPS